MSNEARTPSPRPRRGRRVRYRQRPLQAVVRGLVLGLHGGRHVLHMAIMAFFPNLSASDVSFTHGRHRGHRASAGDRGSAAAGADPASGEPGDLRADASTRTSRSRRPPSRTTVPTTFRPRGRTPERGGRRAHLHALHRGPRGAQPAGGGARPSSGSIRPCFVTPAWAEPCSCTSSSTITGSCRSSVSRVLRAQCPGPGRHAGRRGLRVLGGHEPRPAGSGVDPDPHHLPDALTPHAGPAHAGADIAPMRSEAPLPPTGGGASAHLRTFRGRPRPSPHAGCRRWFRAGRRARTFRRCNESVCGIVWSASARNSPGGATGRGGRPGAEVTLVAVTKGHPFDVVEAALSAGLTDLGENRVEALVERAARVEAGRLPLAHDREAPAEAGYRSCTGSRTWCTRWTRSAWRSGWTGRRRRGPPRSASSCR
jgi:hypothetical protein